MKTLMKVAIGTGAVTAAAIIGVNLLSEGPTVGGPSAGSTLPPIPSLSPVPLPVDAAIVYGWPGVRSNPAGRYSWNVRHESWMHNPNNEGVGVSITFSASSNAYESGPTTVTVAGYNGTYQELPTGADGPRKELWIVDIGTTRVAITVAAEPSTTEADLAEAYAIIESIRNEPKTHGAGVRLTFTLPNGWDSG